MSDCIFCKIVKGEIPSSKVYEDDMILAFKDLNPVSPHHILVIPKIHIASLNEVNSQNSAYIERIMIKIGEIAKDLGIAEDGYRVVANTGDDGGQTVHHLHFHIVGGRSFAWPPG